MIFATVGTQLPFPRLIDALNAIAATEREAIIAQTGPYEGQAPHLELSNHLTPKEFDTLFSQARIVVAHAGIGTILSAKRHGKPLVLLPRRHALGEHRNDHQLATARAVESLPGVHIAWEAADLAELLRNPALDAPNDAPGPAHAALITKLRQFIDG